MASYRVEHEVEHTTSGEGLNSWEIIYQDEGDTWPLLIATVYTKRDAEQIANLLNEEEGS